jgi:histidine ammonia-lyase
MVAAQQHIDSRSGAAEVLVLTGGDLTTDLIARFVRDADIEVSVDPEALARVGAAEAFLKAEIDDNVVYGINTGFGPMASHLIGRSQLINLQSNLIRSHAAGMGDPIAGEYVLAAMLVRLNTFAKGHSGVSEQLLVQLQQFVNHRILPLVAARPHSVGAHR